MIDRDASFSEAFEDALRFAAERHREQTRKGSDIPYLTHLVGVARILDRLGYPEDVVLAGLLHDVLEDTPTEREEIVSRFGGRVAGWVAACSETKRDPSGRPRPWAVRKRDHLEELLERAEPEARAIVLADKLHNLATIRMDIRRHGAAAIWSRFNAPKDESLKMHRELIERLGFASEDPRLVALAREALAIVAELERGDTAVS